MHNVGQTCACTVASPITAVRVGAVVTILAGNGVTAGVSHAGSGAGGPSVAGSAGAVPSSITFVVSSCAITVIAGDSVAGSTGLAGIRIRFTTVAGCGGRPNRWQMPRPAQAMPAETGHQSKITSTTINNKV